MKDLEMRRTASALKWLAEKRARTLTDYNQLKSLAEEVNARFERARLDLEALDRALEIYDPEIDPTKIEPVKATKGAYGRHGALRDSILDAIQLQAPNWVSTDYVESVVMLKLGLSFELPALRRRWHDNSLRSELKRQVEEGRIERQHDPERSSGVVGYWRWKQKKMPTLAELKGHAPQTR